METSTWISSGSVEENHGVVGDWEVKARIFMPVSMALTSIAVYKVVATESPISDSESPN